MNEPCVTEGVLLDAATLRPRAMLAEPYAKPATVMVTVSVAVPTVMPYLVAALATVGVPLMAPVEVFSIRPVGREGLMLYVPEPTTPLTVSAVAGTFLPKMGDETPYAKPFTVMSSVSVVDAMLFTVAVMVYFVREEETVGVPVITHVVVFKARPVGRDGEMEHAVGAPPMLFGVVVPAFTLRLNVSAWLG